VLILNNTKSCFTTALTAFSLVFSSPVYAKKNVKKITYSQTAALASANLIGRYKTVGQFLRVFKPHMNAGEYRNFKKILAVKNISMFDKIPKVKAAGNKIFIANGGGVIEIKNAKTFIINGHKFNGSKESLATRFEAIHSKLSKNKKTKVSLLNLLVPEAQAFGDLMGIVSIVGAGLGGYYLGPKLGVKNSTGALLGVGGLYLATELWQSFKSGDVTCTDDGRYQVRKKGRNMWFMAMSEQSIISSAKVREAGLSENCTSNNAKALSEWGSVDRLQAPVSETTSSSSAIYGE